MIVQFSCVVGDKATITQNFQPKLMWFDDISLNMQKYDGHQH